ncbi:hypothetical protein P12x_000960 [Tundrisphaera lichenicola]|uniref:hypothetical protein n=1 Tax=Tundrisphaera lichenicola TaxID=2029860 RepID=UPI003EBE366F
MKWTVVDLGVIVTCALISLGSARDYAGGSNDGSRLASVESLVDHRTWVIDRSIFVDPAQASRLEIWPPRSPHPEGIIDKLRIDGHYYSDKPPVTAVLMAAVYQVIQWTTGLVARESPGLFCAWMTLTSSGLAFVLASWCLYRIGLESGLSRRSSVLLAASLALATVAPAYSRQVNASILLLAIAMALMLVLVRIPEGSDRNSGKSALLAGGLAGLGYSTDLGCGPVLVLCVGAWLFHRGSFRLAPLIWYGVGAFPWLLGHHALNYMIGGTIGPMNTVPEYFRWPGSPFTEANLTGGGAGHANLLEYLSHANGFLFGWKGFICHNPTLLLAFPATLALLRTRRPDRPLVLASAAWASGTWLLYSLQSSDLSGFNISVRWLVPTIAAGYLILARNLGRDPGSAYDLGLMSLFALPISGFDWWVGTWAHRHVPGLFPWLGLAVLAWFAAYLERTGRISEAARRWRGRSKKGDPAIALRPKSLLVEDGGA